MVGTVNPADRADLIRQFEDTKLGVKGLVDSGITVIPPLFVHPPETLADVKPKGPEEHAVDIPIIDLSAGTREEVVELVARAAHEVGFFQVVNHGVEPEVLERLIGAVRAFHEQDPNIKQANYTRTGRVSFFSNVDLFHSKAASWRDTLQIRLSPEFENDEEFPEICRDELREYDKGIKGLARELYGLLCEGLGLNTSKLEDMTCLEARTMVGHYYPQCPQPDLTFGITSHTDPGVITILLQDEVGGLQIKRGDEWIDAKPVPGALVVNIGDILQIMSNDEYQSVDHRVLANPNPKPRVSIAVFFNPCDRARTFGPFPELTSTERPAAFKVFTFSDYLGRFFSKQLDGKSLVNYYRV
ncbi:hypothetical protein MLD38_011369 [Melastoma candidum]|uniref:Uncharacterized protein n=1 Tax=Melastoma candidum TaxID=119954 RepID=A0ACB9R6D0_9MYRT|nr:hypothetical protein MLD38_011369 [Melastoma candidum]